MSHGSTSELSFSYLIYKLARSNYETDLFRKARACAKRLGVRRLDAALELSGPKERRWKKYSDGADGLSKSTAIPRRRQAAALQGAFGTEVREPPLPAGCPPPSSHGKIEASGSWFGLILLKECRRRKLR
jgi:hypothetical protein